MDCFRADFALKSRRAARSGWSGLPGRIEDFRFRPQQRISPGQFFRCQIIKSFRILPLFRGSVFLMHFLSGSRYDELREFAAAIWARPTVARTLVSRERLIGNYGGYADNSATSTVAQQFRVARDDAGPKL